VTLKGFKHLAEKLFNLGIDQFFPRALNLDPLRTFFEKVHLRNKNPTSALFSSLFKALLFNTISSVYVVDTDSEYIDFKLLIGIEYFVNVEQQPQQTETEPWEVTYTDITTEDLKSIKLDSVECVTEFVNQKIIPKSKNCNICQSNILKDGTVNHTNLQHCDERLIMGLSHIYLLTKYILPITCHKKDFYGLLVQEVNEKVNFNFEPCDHSTELEKSIKEPFLKVSVENFFKEVNQLLTGKNINSTDGNTCNVIYTDAKNLSSAKRKRRGPKKKINHSPAKNTNQIDAGVI